MSVGWLESGGFSKSYIAVIYCCIGVLVYRCHSEMGRVMEQVMLHVC